MLHAVDYSSSSLGSFACFFSTQSCPEFNKKRKVSAVRVCAFVVEPLQKPGCMLWEGLGGWVLVDARAAMLSARCLALEGIL